MIVEVRTYRIKEGQRAKFIETFERRSVPIHREIGITIVGPLLDMENPDAFVFLRGFPSLEERERMKSAFYDGEVWKNELEAILMPMIESYSAVFTEPAPGFTADSLA